MIFVTVGSTYFDELIREVDGLAGSGAFPEPVVCQIGTGKYIPENCEWFRSTDQFDHYLSSCNLLITHGGITSLEAVWRNLNFIAVANVQLSGNHQFHFLKTLDEQFGIAWTDDPKSVGTLLKTIDSKTRPAWTRPPHIADFIKSVMVSARA